MTTIVKLPIKCNRQDKEILESVAYEDITTVVSNVDARKANAEKLAAIINQMSPDQVPHFVAIYKGSVVILPTVHASEDNAVKRALNAAVGCPADKPVFPVPPPKARAPKTPTESAAPAPVEDKEEEILVEE